MARNANARSTKKTSSSFTFLKGTKLDMDYQKEILFILTIGLTCYYYLALYSYSPLDPSWVSKSFPAVKATNLAGQVGANISGYLIYLLGVGAYLLALPFISSTMFNLIGTEKKSTTTRTLGWISAILVTSSLMASYVEPIYYSGYPIPSGGTIGTYLANFLNTLLGETGSSILLITLALASFMMIFKKGILKPTALYFSSQLKKNFHKNIFKKLSLPKFTPPKIPTLKRKTIDVSPDIDPEKNTHHEDHLMGLEPSVFIEDDENEIKQEVIPFKKKQTEKGFQGLHSLFKSPKGHYQTPSISVFNRTKKDSISKLINKKELEQTAKLLKETLEEFNIKGEVIGFQTGPVVTVYEFQPPAGVKQSKIIGLIDDIALALKVDSILIHPVRGKRALGIQVPNRKRETVYLGDILESDTFKKADNPLTFAIGKSINGSPVCTNIAATPHLLIAGATGSGKSVGINSLLCSIIMKASPEEVRMILVDPKMLELSVYEGIPHLLMPVITDPNKASLALKWAVNEMERRYKLMQLASVRNIEAFNKFWDKATDAQKDIIKEKLEDDNICRLPYTLLVIDELADLMLCAPKEIESIIQRLAQKARASGIHMVLATQRPSVDIITGVIKANLPSRIAFQVVSKHDSRTILDQMGADKLLGRGDMLFQKPGVGQLERIQGALVSDEEVVNLVADLKSQENYDQNLINWIEEEATKADSDPGISGSDDVDDDPKWDEAISIAQGHGAISASFLQRQLKIGYNRAARIVESMESQGLVGKSEGSKPRKWLGNEPSVMP